MKRITSLLLLGLASASAAATAPIPKPKKTAVVVNQKPAEVLWDAWYTVTVSDSQHYGYYNDHVETKDGKVMFKNQFWKNEEGFINEESLGTFSDATTLAPLFFNFRSVYRTTETQIDGTVNGNELSVKTVRGGKELPIVRRALPPRTIFSAVFPVWLARKLPELKVDAHASFMTILEDNVEQQFNTVSGLARLEKPDEYAKKTGSKKIHVLYRDLASEWYFDDKGVPVRINMNGQKTRINRVSREEAEKFLRNIPPPDSAQAPSEPVPDTARTPAGEVEPEPRTRHEFRENPRAQ